MNDVYKDHSGQLLAALGNLNEWHEQVTTVAHILKDAFAAGKTVYVAGNGGSATLAQHLSDEMVGRYDADRQPYPVVALTADSAVLTVIGNDYGYDQIFRRQLEALGHPGDIFVAFSTSGSSKNILTAVEKAKELGMKVIAFTSKYGPLKDVADFSIISPAKTTARIQELDLHAIHLICEAFEPVQKPGRLSADRIEEILSTFAEKRVLVIGDVFIDHYAYGKVDRVSPEAPVPVVQVERHVEMTGGAGNVAKNAASVGTTTILVSVVGQDEATQRLENLAQNEHYTARLVEDESRPTIRKMRYLAGNQQLLRIDHEKTHNISRDVEDKVIVRIKDIFKEGIDGVIVSDYAKGVVTERLAQAIKDLAKEYNVPVAADLKPSRASYFQGVSFMSPNLKEGYEYLGLNPLDEAAKKEPSELAYLLRERFNSDIYLTLGGNGMYVSTADHEVHVPQDHKVEVFDVSGAGDTAVTILLLARLAGATSEEAARIANAAGAVVVSKAGSVGVTTEEIRRTLMKKN